jgi:hypothetical protein
MNPVIFRNNFFTARSSSSLAHPPSGRTIPCRLSATFYLTYSHLTSKSTGRLLHSQPEDAPCSGDPKI